MTAAGLDYVSDGRFTLGLGASGPQVIEGFHGVQVRRPARAHPRDRRDLPPGVAPREGPVLQGKHYQIPLPAEQGTGPRQAAEDHQPPGARPHPDRPRRDRAEERRADRRDRRGLAADLLRPRAGARGVGRVAGAGKAKRDPALGDLQVYLQASLCITEDEATAQAMLDGDAPVRRALRRRHGREGQELLQRRRPPLRLRGRRRRRSRTSTSTARRTRPPRRCPRSWCARCR